MNFVRTLTRTTTHSPQPQKESERSVWGLFDQYGNERKIEVLPIDEGNRIGFKRYD
jgi:hypothetical protein